MSSFRSAEKAEVNVVVNVTAPAQPASTGPVEVDTTGDGFKNAGKKHERLEHVGAFFCAPPPGKPPLLPPSSEPHVCARVCDNYA